MRRNVVAFTYFQLKDQDRLDIR